MKIFIQAIQAFLLVFFQFVELNGQTLDQQFPKVDGRVNTICIHGRTLYIGGNFTVVGGQSRHNIAAIDIPTKSVTTWAPNPNDDVVDIKAANGKVYFCGHFTQVNTSLRNALAMVDSITGIVDPLNPTIVFPGIPGMQTGTVSSLEITANTLYFAGYFLSVNGSSRKNIAAIDVVSGNLKPFIVSPDIPINIIKMANNILYWGGPFYSVNGSDRKGFAAVDPINGALLPWNPSCGSPGNTIYSIVPDGDSVLISGFIFNLNNTDHCFLAKTDKNGQASAWKPFSCNGPIQLARAINLSDSIVVIGGEFSNFSGQNRTNLVLVDRFTRTLSNWIPNPDGAVFSLGSNDSLIVIGGKFNTISNVIHPNLAVYSRKNQQTKAIEPRITVDKIIGYPNPAQSTFTLPLNNADLKNLSIYTKDGKLVSPPYQKDGHLIIIQTEQLPTGEYLVQLETTDNQQHVALFTRISNR